MPFGSGRKDAADWADLEEIESDKLKWQLLLARKLKMLGHIKKM